MNASNSRRSAFPLVVAVGVAALLGGAALLTSAAGKASQAAPQTQCMSSSSCIDAVNTGSGEAIRGIADNNSGVSGATRASSTRSGPEHINAGVKGFDTSAQVGPENFSTGILGFSRTGFGMSGFSKIHAGLYAQTLNPSASDNYGTAGVEGFDRSSDGGQLNVGVEGGTAAGTGVFGFSTLGNGVRGITTNPSSLNQQHRAAVFGIDLSTDGGGLNFGLAGFSPATGGAGISVSAPTAPGAPLAPAVAAYCENGGAAIQAADAIVAPYNLLMTLDCMGNLTVSGVVVSGSLQMTSSASSSGHDVAAYAPRQTEPTMEDFGESRLIDGSAHIELKSDFAAAIDRTSSYLVFITPEGDCRGLFVIGKTIAGFEVRESQGGRSNIGFSYRIVATPFGIHAGRLPLMSEVRARLAAERRRTSFKSADVLKALGANGGIPHMPDTQIPR